MVRKVENVQMQLGSKAISELRKDYRSRDDVPQILQGLQYLYTTPAIKATLFNTLERLIPQEIDPETGRPGMELWRVFVMGVLRLNLNWDYDRLHEMVNQHKTIRQMLGHGTFDEGQEYCLQTLKDNVRLLPPEILDEINQIVVDAGHNTVKKKGTAPGLRGRCDSFVVETNVHYPTDSNLLYDALRKTIPIVGRECAHKKIGGWRQYQYNIKQMKRCYRKVTKIKKANYKDSARREKQAQKVKEIYKAYIEQGQQCLDKIEDSRATLQSKELYNPIVWAAIDNMIGHAKRQIDQIQRRVLQGESIAHSEKIFSLFEPHTEWISKGKAKAPVELGLRVCVMEDQFGFILHHRVMEKQTDVHVAIPMVQETKARFKHFAACSYDKGFYTPENKRQLEQEITLTMPKKGRLNKQEQQEESAPAYIKRRYQHAAVESGINALEVHGLDRCLDKGIDGFKRYVALAVVARNIQQLGAIIHNRNKQRLFKKAA